MKCACHTRSILRVWGSAVFSELRLREAACSRRGHLCGSSNWHLKLELESVGLSQTSVVLPPSLLFFPGANSPHPLRSTQSHHRAIDSGSCQADG